MQIAPVVFQLVADHHAFGVEEREAGSFVHDREQVQVFAEFPVVALFGLFQEGQIVVEVLLLLKSGAIDALQHGILLTAAPIRPGQAHELEGFHAARGGQVRPSAQIHKIPLAVERKGHVFGQILDEHDLIKLPLLAHQSQGLLAREFKAFQRQVAFDDLLHLRLDLAQIFR